MYTVINFKTKSALKHAVKEWREKGGIPVEVYSPGPGKNWPIEDGKHVVEGPHSPDAHTWYAAVLVQGRIITKVLG